MKSFFFILFALLLLASVSMGENLDTDQFYNREIADAIYPPCVNGKCPNESICIDVRGLNICFPTHL
ncbi:hypothetical protein RB653_004549 [Dictyostelium firmibasis]|uniref:Uncharacterized protein n=1 Tax=Dictyostelium firmibasis TaxID=79012 RepID=A0AAN7TZU9_9MYCE